MLARLVFVIGSAAAMVLLMPVAALAAGACGEVKYGTQPAQPHTPQGQCGDAAAIGAIVIGGVLIIVAGGGAFRAAPDHNPHRTKPPVNKTPKNKKPGRQPPRTRNAKGRRGPRPHSKDAARQRKEQRRGRREEQRRGRPDEGKGQRTKDPRMNEYQEPGPGKMPTTTAGQAGELAGNVAGGIGKNIAQGLQAVVGTPRPAPGPGIGAVSVAGPPDIGTLVTAGTLVGIRIGQAINQGGFWIAARNPWIMDIVKSIPKI